MTREEMGWGEFFAKGWKEIMDAEGMLPARIVRAGSRLHLIWCDGEELLAETTGRLHYEARSAVDLPVTGDWVAISRYAGEDRATIRAVLPRKTRLLRRAAGSAIEMQPLAANVDCAFIVNAVDGGRGYNVRRLERWLAIAGEGGVEPAIVLNKADLCADLDAVLAETDVVAPGVPIFVTSAVTGQGLDELRRHVARGRTGVFLGLSGVGKSALLNRLVGEAVQGVAPVREADRRGRHTTTDRELFALPGGGAIIDTPGLREVQLPGHEGLDSAFPDIEWLADACRFHDCRHHGEPGCAVQLALAEGTLDPQRFENYLQLQRELAYLARQTDRRAQREHRAKWKQISKDRKQLKKDGN